MGVSSPVSAQQQSYTVDIQPVPDYATDYASNAIYDATKAWQDANPNIIFYQVDPTHKADLYFRWVKDYGSFADHVGRYDRKSIIQVGLGDSNCLNQWEPYSSRYVEQIAEHAIGHFLGHQDSSDSNSIMNPNLPSEYGRIHLENNLAKNYGWFIPVCTSKDITSFDYNVNTNDPTYGFEVYFVPSKDSLDNFGKGQQFQYYSSNGCFAKNYRAYGTSCKGVTKGSGILIITNSELTNSEATITLEFLEKDYDTTPSQTSWATLPTTPTGTSSGQTPDQTWVWPLIGTIIAVVGLSFSIIQRINRKPKKYQQ